MTNQRKATIVSVALHCAAVLLLAAFIFIDPLRAEDKPVEFELVTLPPDAQQPETPTPQPPQPRLDQPDVRPSQINLPEIDIPEPEPEPQPPPPAPKPPEPVVTPKPEPVTPPKPVEKPKAEPKPEPPKPKMMSLADFDRKNDRRETPQQRPTQRATTEAPKINTDINIKVPTTVTPSPAAANSSLVASYQQRLRNAIELNWDRPASGSGSENAVIQFRVFSNGSIGEVKILNSKGPSTFVESVRQAVITQVSIGPRPQGWDGLMSITFRLR
ncbi:TonB C-terminal domain-containing protein [Cerasicoccus frondis]|uniref:TonB C-terminal domain-containing protein n=1 Tax=Cerasicoccus frondis TaxID=490090 RepID=UPI002852CC68|nr:TonB C-terminal domain-containing protein [Cerasicoccus frondis]